MTTRRVFLATSAAAGVGALIAGCEPPDGSPGIRAVTSAEVSLTWVP